MGSVNIPVQLAPEALNEPILPGWRFSLLSVNLGGSGNADIEKAAIQKIGSYGRQIGHLAEALEVVIDRLGLMDSDLPQDKKDILTVFLADVATARGLKRDAAGS